MDFVVDFADFLQSLGFIVNYSDIKADGKFHRVKYQDDSRGKASGSYVLFADSHPAGYVQNFKLGTSFTWKYHGSKLQSFINPSEYAKVKLQRKKAQEQEYKRNVWYAFQKFQELLLKPKVETYLDKKQVKGYGVRFDHDNNMYVPYRDNNGYIQTLQMITPLGDKRFATGCKKVGGYHKIGFYDIDVKYDGNYSGAILIGEGYATMASVFMATGLPVVIAGDAGNLIHVVENILKKYPQAKLVICSDNDKIGLSKAYDCQMKFDCQVVVPECGSSGTDFNDLHQLVGLEAVRVQILQQLSNIANKVLLSS